MKGGNWTREVRDLLARQKESWPLAAANYLGLGSVKFREIPMEDGALRLQFNPRRLVSTAARVDSEAIRARPCFLCPAHRPPEQEALPCRDYLILCNPFPIFEEHLTIVAPEHCAQRIQGRFPDLLDLSRRLEGFVVFYNGPECGASAPDHMHFQAGESKFLPMCFEKFAPVRRGRVDLLSWENLGRRGVVFESSDACALADASESMFAILSELQPERPEPMINLLAWHARGRWRVVVFPRKLHRPRQFFAAGPEQVMVSPASVDIGGVIVCPREKDYEELTAETASDIFGQVCLDAADFAGILERLEKSTSALRKRSLRS